MSEHRRAWNPIKHGWVRRVAELPRFSFHAFGRLGIYLEDWGGENVASLGAGSNASDAFPFVHRILRVLKIETTEGKIATFTSNLRRACTVGIDWRWYWHSLAPR